jgi:hypothetical protein
MLRKKSKQEPDSVTHARVKQEMAKPRTARSAKIAELKLATERVPESPSTILSGTVNKIIRSPIAGEADNAQIIVDVPDKQYQELRIENSLTDEHGDEVRLKKGSRVDVTVRAKDPVQHN